MISRLFLSNVRGAYASTASQFSAMVGLYCPGRDGIVRCNDPFPHHLTVMELARTLHDDAARRASTSPRSSAFHLSQHSHNDTFSLHSPVSTLASATTLDASSHLDARPNHIQGYTVNATRRTSTSHTRRTEPNPSSRPALPRQPQHQGPCEACGKYGHQAVRCDMLGMALFLQRYSGNRSNQDTIREAEARWVERNKRHLPRDDRTPRTILANYCAEMNFTEDKIDSELDWDFLRDDDFQDSAPADE